MYLTKKNDVFFLENISISEFFVRYNEQITTIYHRKKIKDVELKTIWCDDFEKHNIYFVHEWKNGNWMNGEPIKLKGKVNNCITRAPALMWNNNIVILDKNNRIDFHRPRLIVFDCLCPTRAQLCFFGELLNDNLRKLLCIEELGEEL